MPQCGVGVAAAGLLAPLRPAAAGDSHQTAAAPLHRAAPLQTACTVNVDLAFIRCCSWLVHFLQAAGQPPVQPVTLALVDAAGPDDFLDLVRGGLTVAMEALPPASLFGIIGISDSITLVDMSGRGACLPVNA